MEEELFENGRTHTTAFSQARDNVVEVEQLQQNVSALLSAIEEERAYRARLEAKLVTLQEEMLEARTQADIEIDGYKVCFVFRFLYFKYFFHRWKWFA